MARLSCIAVMGIRSVNLKRTFVALSVKVDILDCAKTLDLQVADRRSEMQSSSQRLKAGVREANRSLGIIGCRAAFD